MALLQTKTLSRTMSFENEKRELYELLKDTPLVDYVDGLAACGLTRGQLLQLRPASFGHEMLQVVKHCGHRIELLEIASLLRNAACRDDDTFLSLNGSPLPRPVPTVTRTISSPPASTSTTPTPLEIDLDQPATLFNFIAHVVPSFKIESGRSHKLLAHLKAQTGASIDIIMFHLARSRSASVYRFARTDPWRLFRTLLQAWGVAKADVVRNISLCRDVVSHVTQQNGRRFRDLQVALIAANSEWASAIEAAIKQMIKHNVYNPSTLRLRSDWRSVLATRVAVKLGVDGQRLLHEFQQAAMELCDMVDIQEDDDSYFFTHAAARASAEVLDAELRANCFRHGKLRSDASDGECELLALKIYLRVKRNNVPLRISDFRGSWWWDDVKGKLRKVNTNIMINTNNTNDNDNVMVTNNCVSKKRQLDDVAFEPERQPTKHERFVGDLFQNQSDNQRHDLPR
jgi:hypothetical protein